MDYEIVQVRKYDGSNAKEAAIEVFNTATGEVVAICRRTYMETKRDWVARAFRQAAAA